MKVTYYQRKSIPGMYSIERLFDDCRGSMPSDVEFRIAVPRFHSRGIFRRFYNSIEAIFSQSDINHITGDVHYLALFLKKKRTILTVLDCGILERLHGVKKVLVFLFWYYLPEKKSAVISVISESTKNELLRYLRCDPNKIRVVHCPLSKAFMPALYSFNATKPVVLQIGTTENKNLPNVAQALKDIPCHLHIVGRPSEKQVNALHRNRIDHSFAAEISNEEMVTKYRKCDMVVFASTYEGFGLPIIEANATGRPVVTSNILSMPEVAGDAACLVDPFDVRSIRRGILQVIEDTPYREMLIQNGFRNVERFQPEAIAAKYVAIYKELASRA